VGDKEQLVRQIGDAGNDGADWGNRILYQSGCFGGRQASIYYQHVIDVIQREILLLFGFILPGEWIKLII
jgi:hypothetical protein